MTTPWPSGITMAQQMLSSAACKIECRDLEANEGLDPRGDPNYKAVQDLVILTAPRLLGVNLPHIFTNRG